MHTMIAWFKFNLSTREMMAVHIWIKPWYNYDDDDDCMINWTNQNNATRLNEYMPRCLATLKPFPTRNLNVLWKLSRFFF